MSTAGRAHIYSTSCTDVQLDRFNLRIRTSRTSRKEETLHEVKFQVKVKVKVCSSQLRIISINRKQAIFPWLATTRRHFPVFPTVRGADVPCHSPAGSFGGPAPFFHDATTTSCLTRRATLICRELNHIHQPTRTHTRTHTHMRAHGP